MCAFKQSCISLLYMSCKTVKSNNLQLRKTQPICLDFNPSSVHPGWSEVSKGMSRRMEVGPAVGVRRLLNGPASKGGRRIWRMRKSAGSVCHRRSCSTSSSTCLYWIGLLPPRYLYNDATFIAALSRPYLGGDGIISCLLIVWWWLLRTYWSLLLDSSGTVTFLPFFLLICKPLLTHYVDIIIPKCLLSLSNGGF